MTAGARRMLLTLTLALTLILTLGFVWPRACPGCAGGGEADHSFGVPLGWESGLAPRRLRLQPHLGRQAARRRPVRGAQVPHAGRLVLCGGARSVCGRW